MGEPWRVVDEWEDDGAEKAPSSRSEGWDVVEEWTPVAESVAGPDPKPKPVPKSTMGFGERVSGVAKESLKRGGKDRKSVV